MSFYISLILMGTFMANIVCDNMYTELQYARNNAIRLILSDELNRTKNRYNVVKKMINRNIINKYNKVLSRCYDIHYNYNCLTDSEKTLLEVIVSLSY
jgi:hypothetical protein